MKKIVLFLSLGVFLAACNTDQKNKTTADSTAASVEKPAMDMPYKASYSSTWTTNVSDADLKMVLMTYKNWSDGNMTELEKALSDTIAVDMASGIHLVKPKADIVKMWGTYRDSLSSVNIDMEGWHKMYEPNKKEGYIVTWYKETDTYKNGKVDSAYYHDINQVKDGKIVWYSTYKRPAK
ncbi:nuclear transport factor 2-like protein [Solitalea koreensis]|uniref:SnoaL-like domain-containing protein n=1 Tax=Solitalea koreensis TaxID=543615 RepID=A0A521E185_9SPHI|nr:hypothetical protein [Solitalea koreensis]SMO77737.1 hypothetical protein SAMN06265350_11025 [Solitalea koreensis]